MKDLRLLGRDLTKVLIIDNNSNNFQRQPENGICIRGWLNDPDDTALLNLTHILLDVIKKEPIDLRIQLK